MCRCVMADLSQTMCTDDNGPSAKDMLLKLLMLQGNATAEVFVRSCLTKKKIPTEEIEADMVGQLEIFMDMHAKMKQHGPLPTLVMQAEFALMMCKDTDEHLKRYGFLKGDGTYGAGNMIWSGALNAAAETGSPLMFANTWNNDVRLRGAITSQEGVQLLRNMFLNKPLPIYVRHTTWTEMFQYFGNFVHAMLILPPDEDQCKTLLRVLLDSHDVALNLGGFLWLSKFSSRKWTRPFVRWVRDLLYSRCDTYAKSGVFNVYLGDHLTMLVMLSHIGKMDSRKLPIETKTMQHPILYLIENAATWTGWNPWKILHGFMVFDCKLVFAQSDAEVLRRLRHMDLDVQWPQHKGMTYSTAARTHVTTLTRFIE